MEILIKDHLDSQQKYMDQKFQTLFAHHGIQEIATSNKWILRVKQLLRQELFILAVGVVLYHVIWILVKYFGVT
jgi:hypothetical protein